MCSLLVSFMIGTKKRCYAIFHSIYLIQCTVGYMYGTTERDLISCICVYLFDRTERRIAICMLSFVYAFIIT